MVYSVSIVSSLDRVLSEVLNSELLGVVEALSSRYSFSSSEALSYLGLTEGVSLVRGGGKGKLKEKGKGKERSENVRASLPLPYCGRESVRSDWCQAVRVNHQLYSQCMNVRVSGSSYCLTCKKNAEKNGGNHCMER